MAQLNHFTWDGHEKYFGLQLKALRNAIGSGGEPISEPVLELTKKGGKNEREWDDKI